MQMHKMATSLSEPGSLRGVLRHLLGDFTSRCSIWLHRFHVVYCGGICRECRIRVCDACRDRHQGDETYPEWATVDCCDVCMGALGTRRGICASCKRRYHLVQCGGICPRCRRYFCEICEHRHGACFPAQGTKRSSSWSIGPGGMQSLCVTMVVGTSDAAFGKEETSEPITFAEVSHLMIWLIGVGWMLCQVVRVVHE